MIYEYFLLSFGTYFYFLVDGVFSTKVLYFSSVFVLLVHI